MTNQLIPLETRTIAGEPVQTVNARDLHTFLTVGKMFAHWIKARIDEYGFVENQDFVSFCQNGQKPQGGRPSIEYCLTIDMAKELAMVERTPKGREVRQYFIECERRLRASLTRPALDPDAMIITKDEYIALLKEQIAGLKVRLSLQEAEAPRSPQQTGFDFAMPAPKTLGERLRWFIDSTVGRHHGALLEFAEQIGWKYRTLQDVLSGQRMPGSWLLARLAEHAQVDLQWLLTGEGRP